MKKVSLDLKPFPRSAVHNDLRIACNVMRHSGALSITYNVRYPAGNILVPAPAVLPARTDGLWKETCLEFFLGPKGQDSYWEFNLSPSGNWNIYRFISYRKDMKEEQKVAELPFTVDPSPGALRISLEYDLRSIIPDSTPIDMGISAVLILKNGIETFWALAHPGEKPDFHRREGFIAGI